MLPLYLKIWDWDLIFGRAVKVISVTRRIKNVLKKLGLIKTEKNVIFTLVFKMNQELLKSVSIKQATLFEQAGWKIISK